MQYLFSETERIEKMIGSKNIFLFLDYDGTLAPITNTPAQATLPIKTRRILEELVRSPACRVAIVSGRAVADLRQMVKLKDVIYIGNHGLEIKDSDPAFSAPQTKELRYALWNSFQLLNELLSTIQGIFIEDKKYTLSIHYRMVATAHVAKIKQTVKKVVSFHTADNILKLKYGKEVIEVLPAINWNKGSAAQFLMDNCPASFNKNTFPVCIGDDSTDEDLFLPFRNKGLTIRVGKSLNSNAAYFVEDTLEVQKFLNELSLLKNKNAFSL